jgi:hypothetical protein
MPPPMPVDDNIWNLNRYALLTLQGTIQGPSNKKLYLSECITFKDWRHKNQKIVYDPCMKDITWIEKERLRRTGMDNKSHRESAKA